MVKAAKPSFMKPQKRKDGVFKMTQYPGLTQRQAQQNRVDYGDNLLENSRKKNPIKISCLGTKQLFSEQEIFFLQPL